MKRGRRYSSLIFVFFMLTLCAGCAFGGGNGAAESGDKILESQEASVFQGDKQWFINGVSYDKEYVCALVNSHKNLSASENIYFHVPQKCQLLKYVYMAPEDRSNGPYIEEFYQVYDYLFPGHPLDDSYLFYLGKDSQVGNEGGLNLVRDHEEEILANKNGPVVFVYDETKKPDAAAGDSYVKLELGNPIGYGYAVIKKGKTAKILLAMSGQEYYSRMESHNPEFYFSEVDYYSPESEQSFPLLDKEVRIKDAVSFYETYMAEFPFPKEGNAEVKVAEVRVLKVKEGQYAYELLTTSEFEGIPIDHMRSGTSFSTSLGYYLFSGGAALMLESGEIDVIENFRKLQKSTKVMEMQEGIPLEDAVGLLSKAITNHVNFEVERVEIVYRQEYVPDEGGYLNLETYEMNVSPWWRFTLYNANDEMTYVFYVDAVDGTVERLKTHRRLDLKP